MKMRSVLFLREGKLLASLCRCQQKTSIPVIPHLGQTYIAHASSSAKTKSNAAIRKALNASFVKRWNKENTALYGEKWTKKKKGKKKKDAATTALEPEEHQNVGSQQMKILQNALKTLPEVPVSNEHVEEQSNTHDSDEADKRNHSSSIVSLEDELKPIAQFPLFISADRDEDEVNAFDLLKGQRAVSVSQILNKTKDSQSEFALNNWIRQQKELLGQEGFAKAQRDRLRTSSTFHGCLEQFLGGTPAHLLNIETEVEPYWHSMTNILPNIEEVMGVEVKLNHPDLKYTGQVDCVGKYKGENCVIEWKTSSKPKPSIKSLFDYPLQTAAYLGALQCNGGDSLTVPGSEVLNILLVIAYEDGSPAHAHFLSPQQATPHWRAWCQRVHMFWHLKLSGQLDK